MNLKWGKTSRCTRAFCYIYCFEAKKMIWTSHLHIYLFSVNCTQSSEQCLCLHIMLLYVFELKLRNSAQTKLRFEPLVLKDPEHPESSSSHCCFWTCNSWYTWGFLVQGIVGLTLTSSPILVTAICHRWHVQISLTEISFSGVTSQPSLIYLLYPVSWSKSSTSQKRVVCVWLFFVIPLLPTPEGIPTNPTHSKRTPNCLYNYNQSHCPRRNSDQLCPLWKEFWPIPPIMFVPSHNVL